MDGKGSPWRGRGGRHLGAPWALNREPPCLRALSLPGSPGADLIFVPDAGHSTCESGISRALVAATDRFPIPGS